MRRLWEGARAAAEHAQRVAEFREARKHLGPDDRDEQDHKRAAEPELKGE